VIGRDSSSNLDRGLLWLEMMIVNMEIFPGPSSWQWTYTLASSSGWLRSGK
jgi:hypothetical protein